MILVHSNSQILKYASRTLVIHLMRKCEIWYMTSTELKFYNIFWHLMRFCTSVNYFENMSPFSEKTHFTNQYNKNNKIGIFFALHMLKVFLQILLSVIWYQTVKRNLISVTYQAGFWRRYSGMRAKILTSKSKSVFLYINIFYNTLTFLHFNTNQNLFRLKKVYFSLCKQCRKTF